MTSTEVDDLAAARNASSPVRTSAHLEPRPGNPREYAEFRAAVRAQYDRKERAFEAGDADSIVTHFYAADALSAGEGFGIKFGRDEFLADYREFVRLYYVRIDSVMARVSGDVGWDWANFYVTPKDPNDGQPFTLVVLFLWTRENGTWVSRGEAFVRGELSRTRFVG